MTSSHSERYWSEVETWDRERIQATQLEKLRRQLNYVGTHSTFYQRQWKELDFHPEDIREVSDLARLPTVRKSDYVSSLTEPGPWGSMLAAPLDDVVRVHFSSGTTSAPTPVCWTQADIDRWAELYARAAYSQGIRRSDVYQVLFGYPWFVGGLGVTRAYGDIGATVIPGGAGETERQIDVMEKYGTTAVSGTPSFMMHLAEAAQNLGRPLTGNKVKRIQVGGEPGGAVLETRRFIEEAWGAKVFDGYGSLEFQPIAWECEEQSGGHIAEDFALAEVVDIETGKPVADGTPGVLVLTHLDKKATPLVRWWTGDVVVRTTEPCACGRRLARLPGGVQGRGDDMLVVRGVNLFPSAVEAIVRGFPGASGEHQIVLDSSMKDSKTGFANGIKLRAELPLDDPSVAERLAKAVRTELTVRCVVEPVGFGTLERSMHKSKRVIREP